MMFRMIMMVGGLIVAAPMLLMTVWGMNVSLWTSQSMAANEAYLDGGELPDVRDIPRTPWGWWADRRDTQETLDTETLTDERTVAMRRVLTIEDVLAEGEAVPDPVNHEFYMTVRAPGYMIDECAKVLRVFASKCDVLRSRVWPDSDGGFNVEADLAYLPSYPLGDTESVEYGDFISSYHRLTMMSEIDPVTDRRTQPDYSEIEVNAHLTLALDVCAELSDRFGNCIIGSMSVYEEREYVNYDDRRNGIPPVPKLNANAKFMVFADERATTSEDLAAALDEIAPVHY